MIKHYEKCSHSDTEQFKISLIIVHFRIAKWFYFKLLVNKYLKHILYFLKTLFNFEFCFCKIQHNTGCLQNLV